MSDFWMREGEVARNMGYDADLFGDPILPEPADLNVRPKTDEERAAANPHSYGRRLTEKLRELAEQGINPLTGTREPEGQTCGDCIHRRVLGYHNRSYPKCDLGPASHGPKTDVRRYWPACHRFEEEQ